MDSLFSNQRWFLAAVLGGVVLLLLLGTLGAREPSADDNAAAEVRRQRLAERDRLAGQAREIQQAGKPAEAIEALESVLALEREVFGAVHEECAGTLEWIASIEEARGDFTVARRRLEEAQQIQVKLHGTGHWRVTDARRALEDLNRRERLTPERRGQLREARNLNSRVVGLYHAGRFGEAIPLAERALEIRRGVLGEDHPDYATSLKNLADLYDSMGEPVAAEPLYRQAMKIVQKALGEDHPDHAAILNNLAVLYQSKGEYAKAEPLYRQALRVARKVLGEDHPQYAAVLNDLALHYDSMGEYAAAEPLYRQALEIQRKSLGEDHPHYAQSLVNLAALYAAVGESKKAEPLCRRALEIRRQALDTTFAVLSERQQFQMSRLFRGALDLYLSRRTASSHHRGSGPHWPT